MSIEIFVLSNRQIVSLEVWQQAINNEGLQLTLSVDGPVDELHGFLPVELEGLASGFECDHCDVHEIAELYPDVDLGQNWKEALAFNSQGFEEDLAAYQAAAAYAKATDGIVFDPQESLVMSPQQAFAVASQYKADIPRMKELLSTTLPKLLKR